MILTAAICCAVLLALILHFLFVGQRKLILGPESFFLVLGTGSFAATLFAAGEAGAFSHPYVHFMGSGLIIFVLGTATSSFLLRFRHHDAFQTFLARPWINDLRGLQFHVLLAVGAVSAAVTAAYFYALGFFVPQEAMRVFLSSGEEGMNLVYNEMRRATSATGSYLAPGYVIQFKNCLLPVVAIILFFRSQLTWKFSDRALFGIFMMGATLASVGTGARFYLAFLAAAFIIIGSAPHMAPFRLTRFQILIVAVAALLLLSMLTLMMGARGQERLVEHDLLWAPLQVLDRVFISPSQERFEVYELFLRHEDAQWGKGLLSELEILLPGRQFYTLSNQLHELLYGSASGNVGLDIWGSLWYDLRWFGLAVIFLYGFICNFFYIRILRGRKSFIRVTTMTYAGLVLGLATDLQMLILRGFVTCMILLFLIGAARFLEAVMVASRPPQFHEMGPSTPN